MSTQETPVLEAETDIKTVTFGKYNYQRVPMLRRAGDPTRRSRTSPRAPRSACRARRPTRVLDRAGQGDARPGLPRRRRRLRARRQRPLRQPDQPAARRLRGRGGDPRGRRTAAAQGRDRDHVRRQAALPALRRVRPRRRRQAARARQQLHRHRGVVQRERGPRREVPRAVAARHRHVAGQQGRDGREVPAALLGRVPGGHRLHDRLRQRRQRLVRRQRPSSRTTTGSAPRRPSGT